MGKKESKASDEYLLDAKIEFFFAVFEEMRLKGSTNICGISKMITEASLEVSSYDFHSFHCYNSI